MLESLWNHRTGLYAAGLGLASLLACVVASHLDWLAQSHSHAPIARKLMGLAFKRWARFALELVRLAYYLGLPFLALLSGWIDLRGMGLALFDWADGARWTIVIYLAAWLLLMAIWLPYLRATGEVVAPPSQSRLTWARRLLEILYMQAHWALYRAVAITFLTTLVPDPLYWGATLGLGLIFVEALADPRVRHRITRVGEADWPIWCGCQAFINTFAFVATRNLYLLFLLQVLLEFTVPHLRPIRTMSRPPLAATGSFPVSRKPQ